MEELTPSKLEVYLVILAPFAGGFGISDPQMRWILGWEHARGVHDPVTKENRKEVFQEGVVCEVDGEHLVDAQKHCHVRVLASKRRGGPEDNPWLD